MATLAVDNMPESEEKPHTPPTEGHQDEPLPSWFIPPADGFTAEDLDHLPQLPPHSELIDGSIILVSPQAFFHMFVLRRLESELLGCTPQSMAVLREMTVTLGERQRPEPDILICHAEAIKGLAFTSVRPEDVVLAIEIESPESAERDRLRKPQLYAKAGIPHFWRVEDQQGHPVVFVYENDPVTKKYIATGIHRDRLKLPVPFDIDIDLTDIDRR